MNHIKIEADKVIKSNPIMIKDTGMNKDGLLITIVDECLQKAREIHIESMYEFSQWIFDNDWRLNYSMALWENSVDFNLYSLEDVYRIFLKSKEDIKMKPSEWIQVVFEEKFEKYKVFKEFFKKTNGYEFDILDEFWKFLIDKEFIFNIENKCWESGCQNHKFSTLRELYKFFLWKRNEYI